MNPTETQNRSDETASTGANNTSSTIEKIIRNYGDLLFDLCESVLWNPLYAQVAFRRIMQDIRKHFGRERFVNNERAWVLRIACERLRPLFDRYSRRLTPSEQIELDSTEAVSLRLSRFDSFFHRLSIEDQMLLLLKDKFGIPLSEIATAMSVPEGSLKIRRAQALRALENWLWERA